MAAPLRSKGIQTDYSGFHRAADIQVRASEGTRDTLFGIGQNAGRALFGMRQERREDAQRQQAATERAAERGAVQKRWEAEQASRAQRDAERDRRSREEAAASFLEERYMGAVGELKEVMAAKAANPDIEQDPKWNEAWNASRAREKDLRAKLTAVRSRLTALPAEEVDPGAPVDTSFNMGTGPAPSPGAGEEQTLLDLEARLGRVQAQKKTAKSAGMATFLGGLEGTLTAEIELRKRSRQERAKREEEGRRAETNLRQGERWLETYKDLPAFAAVPEEVKRRLAGQVARGRMTWQQARGEMAALLPKPEPSEPAPKPTPEEVGTNRARSAWSERAERLRLGLPLEGQDDGKRDAEKASRDRRLAENDAIKTYTDALGRRDALGDPLEPDTSLLRSDHARTIVESRDAPPAVRALAERVLKERGEGERKAAPAAPAAPAGDPRQTAADEFASLPASEQTPERWEEIKRRHLGQASAEPVSLGFGDAR